MKTFFLLLIGFASASKLDLDRRERRCRKTGNDGLNLNPKFSLGLNNIDSNGFGQLKSKHGSREKQQSTGTNRYPDMTDTLNWKTKTHEDAETMSKRDCRKKKTTTYEICGRYEATDDCGGDNCAKQKKSGASTAIYKRNTRQHLT